VRATSRDALSGELRELDIEETTPAEVAGLCVAAAGAAEGLASMSRHDRASLLDAMADGLESRRLEVVAVTDRETALGRSRLDGELTRTCYQLRLMGEVIREGGVLEVTVDHGCETAMGARPDLRRMLTSVGPVAVFGASNFPLAFSVPGGDTASALAAGSPVVAKAHEAHPATSALCASIISAALAEHGAPMGSFAIVYGRTAGAELVVDPRIKAVGFTGSQQGGRALLALIEQRPEPIPFYGELSGLNPVIVTRAAVEAGAEAVATTLVGSFTQSVGQFCTKPGLIYVPTGDAGDQMVARMVVEVEATSPQPMLTAAIRDNFARGLAQLQAMSGVATLAAIDSADGPFAAPVLLQLSQPPGGTRAAEECFGPVALVRRYRRAADAVEEIADLAGSLTMTIFAHDDDADLVLLARSARSLCGRIVFNGPPTGVAVTWAQHHGGPWPATSSSLHTSVGPAAIRRFLRPQVWQNAPAAVLPVELEDGYDTVPRRIDGVFYPAELPGGGDVDRNALGVRR
jgi:NADP-dependent aldehyde dehydrogenase